MRKNSAVSRFDTRNPWPRGSKANRDKKKDPVVGSTGPSNQFRTWDNESGCLRCLCFGHAFCLRAFLSLNNFEFNIIALLEALVTLRLDGTIVDEHIRAVIPADKAEALCVIEPFHFTFNSRHVPYSGRSLRARSNCGPKGQFSLLGFATFLGRDVGHRRYIPSPARNVLYPYFGFGLILRSSVHDVNLKNVLLSRKIAVTRHIAPA
jgi:hypothetical protein